MTSLAEIKYLQDHYPFQEDELEILLRGHESLKKKEDDDDSFLMKLALCSPYSYFFLPGDEMRNRVAFMEQHVLPDGFSHRLHKALTSSDTFAFGPYGNDEDHRQLEHLLEGVATTGRRGPREAERVLYSLLDEATPQCLVDLCKRLAVASHVLVTPDFHKDLILQQIQHSSIAIESLAKSLMTACARAHYEQKQQQQQDSTTMTTTTDPAGILVDELTDEMMQHWNSKGRQVFQTWVEDCVPLLPCTLSTFIHHLIFHSHPYPPSRTPYVAPFLDHASDIFVNNQAPLLFPLSCTAYQFGGKWHRLYSAEMDGRSFGVLDFSLMGYAGPTLVVIQTQEDVVLGAFASKPWKSNTSTFYGDSDCFLFQLRPTLSVYHALGDAKDANFMYCNPEPRTSLGPHAVGMSGRAHGIGFGGTVEKPRLFVPTNLGNECYAQYLDGTYQNGHLLPIQAMEKFHIKHLEVWGIGGDEVIQKALRHRAEHRETMDTVRQKARTVANKSQFAADMQSGLILNKVFAHQEDVRGQADFVVDDQHGGYKHEHET